MCWYILKMIENITQFAVESYYQPQQLDLVTTSIFRILLTLINETHYFLVNENLNFFLAVLFLDE